MPTPPGGYVVTAPASGTQALWAPGPGNLTPIILTPVAQYAHGGDTTVEVNGESRALYLGRVGAAFTTVKVVFRVTTAIVAGAAAWAEVAICKGTPSANGSASLSRLGYADVLATLGSTGIKVASVALAGCASGDDLWVAWASDCDQAGGGSPTAFDAFIADAIQSGCFQFVAATRPSTMAVPTAFAEIGGSVKGLRCAAGMIV